ncbi:MAG: phosphate/phosphite/phosphonate ABC transporter substrate-binding protein [Chromatiales bacterium]|nr:phosphate/phosphite/phosphonate ABC transporter substrate-binding protein [Chromatiales bacterium]
MSTIVRAIIITWLLVANASALAEDIIIFATAPTHSREATQKAYTPLVDYLNKATGKQFRIEIPFNFLTYSSKMRQGHYDMVFDGPHYTSWRMVSLNYTPIVRFPGEIRIVVATKKDSRFNSIEELETAHVCAFAPPNMLTMAFLSHYPNPITQPTLVRNQGFKKLLECIQKDRGDAVVFRDKLWGKLSDEEKAELKLLKMETRGYPDRTFSVGPKISDELRQQITDALMSEEGLKASEGVRALFKKPNFILARSEEYTGLESLLANTWGFQTK